MVLLQAILHITLLLFKLLLKVLLLDVKLLLELLLLLLKLLFDLVLLVLLRETGTSHWSTELARAAVPVIVLITAYCFWQLTPLQRNQGCQESNFALLRYRLLLTAYSMQ